jgi:hypothetical protein
LPKPLLVLFLFLSPGLQVDFLLAPLQLSLLTTQVEFKHLQLLPDALEPQSLQKVPVAAVVTIALVRAPK